MLQQQQRHCEWTEPPQWLMSIAPPAGSGKRDAERRSWDCCMARTRRLAVRVVHVRTLSVVKHEVRTGTTLTAQRWVRALQQFQLRRSASLFLELAGSATDIRLIPMTLLLLQHFHDRSGSWEMEDWALHHHHHPMLSPLVPPPLRPLKKLKKKGTCVHK